MKRWIWRNEERAIKRKKAAAKALDNVATQWRQQRSTHRQIDRAVPHLVMIKKIGDKRTNACYSKLVPSHVADGKCLPKRLTGPMGMFVLVKPRYEEV